jgi:tetratricopeptide (TPR) repeat protein
MSLRQRPILFTLLSLTAAGLVVDAIVAGRAWFRSSRQRPEYAAAPFRPLGNLPADLMQMSERPVNDRPALKRWVRRQEARLKYLTEGGAIRRGSAGERKAIEAVYAGKYVAAREAAEEVLRENADSIPGRFTLASVQLAGEQNLPRALYEIRQTRYRLERRGQERPDDADSCEWYIRTLELEYEILGYMDRRQDQIDVVDRLEAVYQPVPWLRLFPLIKLHRYDEALALIEEVDRTGRWGKHVLNTRIMMAEQRRDRAGMYEAGKLMVEKYPTSRVLWSNFGLACLADFRHNEAEVAYVRAATTGRQDFHGSAYFSLAMLYAQQSRFQEAWSALQQGQHERGKRKPHTLVQDQSFVDRSIALVLLALGRGEDAERFARRTYDRPGRMGSTTDSQETDRFLGGLTLWAALQTRIEMMREEEVLLVGLRSQIEMQSRRRALELEAWTLKRRLLKMVSDDVFLVELLRPYLAQGHKEPWLMPALVDLLPGGVAAEAIRKARKDESHPAAGAYFDVLEAELHRRNGRHRETLTLARRALEQLPSTGEKLLRARAAALAAEAAHRLGQADEARTLAAQALHDFPQVFRMLDIAIPVRVQAEGGTLAEQVATKLRQSPRFRVDPHGFVIRVKQAGKKLKLSMRSGLTGEDRHFEAEVATRGEPDEVVATAYRRVHERMMSPWLELTAVQINALEIVVLTPPPAATGSGVMP